MSITITKRPNSMLWTYNPIEFEFSYSGVLATAKLQVQVLSGSGVTLAEVQYPFNQANGSMVIDFQNIMDALLSFTLPTLPATAMQLLNQNQQKSVKLRFRQTYLYSNDPWTNDTEDYIIFKGGINNLASLDDKTQNMNPASPGTSSFIPAKFYPDTGHRCLTYLDSPLVTPDQTLFLLYVHYYAVQPVAPFHLQYVVRYTDGTQQIINKQGFNLISNLGFWLPAGVVQCGLSVSGKMVDNYRVRVVHDVNGIALSDYTILVDNRPHYDTMSILYRNSMGGLDGLELFGKTDMSVSVQRGEYYQRYQQKGRNPYYRTELRPAWKANTGYITEDRAIALAELANALEVYTLLNDTYIPLRVKNGDMLLKSSFNKLHNTDVELETADTYPSFPKQLLQL